VDKEITVLDCTLRDGGYYNQWDFGLEEAKGYIDSIDNAGVDVVEIGFRFLSENVFRGAFAYSPDDLITFLDVPRNLKIAVMVNASQFIGRSQSTEQLIRSLFSPKDMSPVDLVRIAVTFDTATQTLPIVETLNDLGYEVALNLMQSSGKQAEEYWTVAEGIAKWDLVDILYFADSLGDMSPHEATRVSENLLKSWSGPLGFHPHNNKGQAFTNMFAAIEAGVSWGDSTIRGMGRGAGNLQTEIFLAELSRRKYIQSDLSALENIFDTFEEWLNKYKWGPNLYYHLAADWGIHPTFIQELLQDRRSRSEGVVPILRKLKDMSASSYSKSVLQHAMMPVDDAHISEGSWDASNWLAGSEVLLVAAGPSTKSYIDGIKLFVAHHSPTVITVNRSQLLEPDMVDAVIASSSTSFALESAHYTELKCPLIAPVNRLRQISSDIPVPGKVLDYGLIIDENSFEIGAKECRLKWDLTAAYGLAVLTQAGASKIYLIGFDGYEDDKEKHEEMSGVFSLYQERYPDIPIVSLTPTTYPVRQGSIYER